MLDVPRPRPPHLHLEITRHGRAVWYVRQSHGSRVRLKAEYGTQEFWQQYRAALEGAPRPTATPRAHTLAWGLARYRESSTWAALSNATRRQSENIYRAVIKTAGDVPLGNITVDTIKAGRDRRAAAPHAANNFLKSMRRFFKWAADLISCAQNVSAVTSTSGSSMSQERVWLRSLVRSFAKSTRTK